MARRESGLNSPSISFNHGGRALGKEDSRIHQAPDRRTVRLPIASVAVIDKHLFTRESIFKSFRALANDLEIECYATADECLQNTRLPDVALYYAHEGITNHGDDCQQHAPLIRLLKIVPVIILSSAEYPESILAAFEIGARGYIPLASTSVELAIQIVRLVRAGGTFMPRGSLFLQETNQLKADLRRIPTHPFTPREMDIIDLLKLGKANKIIAHELGVSEGTIKGNIRSIMKKMNATNRTEVACRA
jgi:DNA-binding NarL/FixJ family response regulator